MEISGAVKLYAGAVEVAKAFYGSAQAWAGGGGSYVAKSVVIDIVNNWGDAGTCGIRKVQFYNDGTLVPLQWSTEYSNTFDGYETSKYTVNTPAGKAFDDGTFWSKTGVYTNGWRSYGWPGSRRIIAVFDTPITFDGIVINNYHESGANTDVGSKDIKITITEDVYTTTTYNGVITNGILIFNGQIAEHTPADEVHDQTLELI